MVKQDILSKKRIRDKDKVALGPRRPTRPELISVSRSMKQLRVLLLPLDGMLVYRRVTSQQYVAGTHLYTWVERDNVGQSIVSKETTRCQGLGVEPPTFRPEVQRANHYTTAPPRPAKKELKDIGETSSIFLGGIELLRINHQKCC